MLSERLTLKVSCFMDYRMFPFDKQICPIVIESYAYRDYQLQLNWRDEDPIQYNSNLQLAEFKLGKKSYVSIKKQPIKFHLGNKMVRNECTRSYVTGDFSCLEGFFILKRNIGYYLLHCFIPSMLCVSIR